MKKIRIHLGIFTGLLVLSGITAFPLQTEMEFMARHLTSFPGFSQAWLSHVAEVVQKTPDVMFYGTDWLAFAHIIIALFFIPVYLNPGQYRWNIYVGLFACVLVFPLAFVFGPLRGIPFFHQLIDCSFGFFGFLYLWFIWRKINSLPHSPKDLEDLPTGIINRK